ncbi:hypothetical protein Tco_1569434 [Tanacetum coccineum]
MVVQAQEEIGEGSAMPTDPHHTPIITQPSSSQPQRKQKSRRSKEVDIKIPQSRCSIDPKKIADEAVNEEPISAASTKVSTVIPTTAATTITTVSSRPRAKGIVFHEQKQEQEQAPTLIKELLKLDEELAFKLQAEEDEEERLAREKAQKVKEANIAWDDIQAKVEADYQLAQRLQAQEQEELSDAEKATLFVQLLEKRRKHFAAKRAEEKRNRPPTKA